MVEFITDFIGRHGPWAVALLMFAENVFPPLPSEIIMPFAGFAAARGDLHPAAAVLSGTAGSVAGGLPWFLLARRWGAERLRRLVERRGHWLAVTPDELDRAGRWFSRHGPPVLVFGRLVPGVRTLVALPAGFCGMAVGPFIAWSVLGSALWCSLLVGAGYALEDRYERMAGALDVLSKAVFGLLALAYVARVVEARRQRRPRV